MKDYDVISKGKLAKSGAENFVYPSSYLFVRNEGKKYLLLKLKNDRAQNVEEVSLRLTLADADGKKLKTLRVSSSSVGGANSYFVFGKKIEVEEECNSFSAEVESAVYGGTVYAVGKDGAVFEQEREEFDLNSVKSKLRGKTRAVSERRLAAPVTVGILCFLLLVCAALITYFQLKDFKKDATDFISSGVIYEFENGDKTEGGNVIVTGYRGVNPKVVIPEKVGGYTVSEISMSAFENNTKIKSVKIEGDTRVGAYAFAGCTKLASVTMNNVTVTGAYAFADCPSLTDISISGEGEISLGKYAFADCPSLKNVTIDKTVIYPESLSVFRGSSSIASLRLKNFDIDGTESVSALFGSTVPDELTELYIGYCNTIGDSFCKGFTNLESVTVVYVYEEEYTIGNYAFYNTNLKNLKIPDGFTAVGDYAFFGTELTSFNGEGVESIGKYAFCASALRSFSVPAELEAVSEGAFKDCSSLESVDFGNAASLVQIGDYAFSGCTSLDEVEVPQEVESLGSQVFYGCKNLQTLSIPFVGSSAASPRTLDYLLGSPSDSGLKYLTLTAAQTLTSFTFDSWTTLRSIELNEGITAIERGAFANCYNLRRITLPSGVTAIASDIFDGCYRLFEIYNFTGRRVTSRYALAIYTSYGDELERCESEGYTLLLSDGRGAQEAGWYLTDYPEGENLTLPDNIAGVANYAVIDYLFYYEQLTSVSVADCVTAVGQNAFCGCTALTDANFANSAALTEIGNYSFYGCVSLKSVSLPDKTSSIGVFAFGCCFSLKEVAFGGSISSIGEYAFTDCTVLASVEINNRYALILGDHSFESCTALKKAIISGGVTDIGQYAFYGCTALQSAEISSATGVVGAYAFCNCSALTEFTVPDGTNRIDEYAFYHCSALNKVTLCSSLIGIQDGSFLHCDKLRAIVNYSRISLEKGSDGYGGIASRAVFVLTNKSDAAAFEYVEISGVTFARLYSEWVAVWCDSSVTSLNLGTISYGGARYDACKIAPYAFENMTSLKTATLGIVTEIGEGAFYGATNLTKVYVSSSLKTVGQLAFYYCLGLTEINLRDSSLSGMGYGAFMYCSALKSAELPATLSGIPERAYFSCTLLEDVIIPEHLTSVGNEAFYGCISLLQVHNLSRLPVTAGSSSYGSVAYYAFYVYTDLSEYMTFATSGNYKFANYCGSWYLYEGTDYSSYRSLPESFTYNFRKITQYTVRTGAITYANNIVIPTSVVRIENNAIQNVYVVYYCGTQMQWLSVRSSDLASARVYYYSKCIHSYGTYWTYDNYGYPSTATTSLNWTQTIAPTCESEGLLTGVCPECGYKETEAVQRLGHSPDEHGVCTRCGEHGVYVTETSATADKYTVTSTKFELSDGVFVTVNTYGTTATFTVTARADITVFFAADFSDLISGDRFTVALNGSTFYTATGGYLYSYEYSDSVDMSAGDRLTFTYNMSGYNYWGYDQCAYLKYILIFS